MRWAGHEDYEKAMEELGEVSKGVVWEVDLARRFCGLQNGVGVTSCVYCYCTAFLSMISSSTEISRLMN